MKNAEIGGGIVAHMPCSEVVMAQVGGGQKRRMIAGPTKREGYDEVERVFAESDRAAVAKAITRDYQRAVVTGTTGTQLFSETTSALKAQVISGGISPEAAVKLQRGSKMLLADVIAGGKVRDATWLSTIDEMCDNTDFHLLAGTPKKPSGLQTGLTPAVGNISLFSQARDRGKRMVADQTERRARRRLGGGLEKDGDSQSTSGSSSYSSSSSTSSYQTSDSSSEKERGQSVEGRSGRLAGRKSKRKKKSKRSKKKKKKYRRAKKKRKLEKRRRKEKRARKRREQEADERGGVSSGTAPNKADPLGASMGT